MFGCGLEVDEFDAWVLDELLGGGVDLFSSSFEGSFAGGWVWVGYGGQMPAHFAVGGSVLAASEAAEANHADAPVAALRHGEGVGEV